MSNCYFYIGYHEEAGFYIDPLGLYHLGIFFKPGGPVHLSNFKVVERGDDSSVLKVCKLEKGCLYAIEYSKNMRIEKAKYLGEGSVEFPPLKRANPPGFLVNEFHIFEKDRLKIYVLKNPKTVYGINVEEEIRKNEEE